MRQTIVFGNGSELRITPNGFSLWCPVTRTWLLDASCIASEDQFTLSPNALIRNKSGEGFGEGVDYWARREKNELRPASHNKRVTARKKAARPKSPKATS